MATFDPTEEWWCAFHDTDGARCHRRGPLAGRLVAFNRHVCYGGHGGVPRIGPDECPTFIDGCHLHWEALTRSHGLDREPDWLRRARLGEQYRGSQPLADARQG